ncbi:SulP family inorganic anion transporter [Microbacterium sp. CFH 90308]|uniref:SulP family inorganic anion transporter n=1 Tax=Microbacterium salsuginis TaxID=2722803 RepID=A0ABX1KC78_9MICO|nr:SulP family inorganic anion transporter [Microbacterium sp. CFH 90308]NLP84642.1 SulP family inorganic anion transporter [Microbacterium sp. CFH 90308]
MGLNPKTWFSRETLGKDVKAGIALGVESVPDGLASGLLAGVNPLAGLYGYLFGMVGAAFFTSSTFMAVQATGAMALVVADADLQSRPDPDRALYTLAMLTGVVMIVAGLARAGRLVRFVPTAVMTGFITAVGVNIVLGQLSNFTGYAAQGANRIVKTIDLLLHIGQWSIPAVVVGAITVLAIVVLQPTRVGSLSLVVAVVLGSIAAWLLNAWVAGPVVVLDDMVDVPRGLPAPVLPSFDDIVYLAIPAVSLAFVGLVQGAGVSAGIPTPDGKPADASRDFIGQGVGNVVAGVFRGMPVGGSMSASALIVAAGARTRWSLVFAGGVMALVILLASGLVAFVAMPALAALLIVVGISAIKPSRVFSVVKSGALQTTIMAVTFVLTLIIPLQFAVLVGVGLGIVMFVAQQSNRVRVRQVHITDDGRLRESDPPASVRPGEVLVLQPYGSLFFASAPTFERQLPRVGADSRGAVVIVRLRGTDEVGLAFIEVLRRYAHELASADASLKIVASEERVIHQLTAGGVVDDIGAANLYRGGEWVSETLRRAYADAREEIARG